MGDLEPELHGVGRELQCGGRSAGQPQRHGAGAARADPGVVPPEGMGQAVMPFAIA